MDARQIAADLEALGDPARAVGERAYLKSDLEHYGVSVPAIRRVTRSVPVASREELLCLVDGLWGPVHDLRMTAIELLMRHLQLLEATDLGVPERLIRDSRSWAYVDPLAIKVSGTLIAGHPAPAIDAPRLPRSRIQVSPAVTRPQSLIGCRLPEPPNCRRNSHSHSMVPGGLLVMSTTTRLTSRTSLVIRVEIFCSTS